jgi:hypothetical protein
MAVAALSLNAGAGEVIKSDYKLAQTQTLA